MAKFDNLFNEFFNGDEKPKKPKNNEVDGVSKVLKDLINFKRTGNTDGLDNCLNDSLGEPDFVEFYEEDGMYFRREIWHTEMGKFVKTGMSDVPFKDEHDEPKFFRDEEDKIKISRPLEEMLEEAVAKEHYELAATLRDEIKRRDENSENQ